MKTSIHLTILFVCFVSRTFGGSRKLPSLRVKRWEGGNMGAGPAPSDLSHMFRGKAGIDYPDFKSIPETSFRCEDQEFEGGLYADVETSCQVYHVCHDGRKDSFICGRGTVFNQQILACDYWYSTECDNAPSYYYVNSQIGNSVSIHKQQDNSDYERNPSPFSVTNSANQRPSNAGENVVHYGGQGQQSCQCFRSINQTPWSFPSGNNK